MTGCRPRAALRTVAVLCALLLPVAAARAAGPLSIAVVGRGPAGPFWQNEQRGASMAAHDLGVTVTFAAPDDGSADTQASLLADALAHRPAAVCLDAVDTQKVLPLLQKAHAQGIPLIGFDAGVDTPLVACTAATDNGPAAALAATKLSALMGETGKVAVVMSAREDPVSADRGKAFAREMSRRHPGITVEDPVYLGEDPSAAGTAAAAMLASDADLTGIFAADEAAAAAVVKAAPGRTGGAVAIVGMDSGQAQVDAVRAGVEAGAVTQDPVRMGYKAVEAAVDALRGRRLPRRIDTGFHWYDRESIDDPALAILLHP